MPLTQSLYVPGYLASTATVIVDVGTGFYVEKTTADALKFYNGKVDDLSKNLAELEKVVQSKNENLRIVEEGPFVTMSSPGGAGEQLLREFFRILDTKMGLLLISSASS